MVYMSLLSIILYLFTCISGEAQTLDNQQRSVGVQRKDSMVIPMVVGGHTYNTYWSSENREEIQNTAESVMCPIFRADGNMKDDKECLQFVKTISQVFQFRQHWVGEFGISYVDGVWNAVNNDTYFENFKSETSYKNIVESLGPLRTQEYLKHLFSQNPDLFYDQVFCERFQENDLYGSPDYINYKIPSRTEQDESGQPILLNRSTGNTIIRYLKVLNDLDSRFNVLTDTSIKSIAEIGIGFGGQAQVMLLFISLQCLISIFIGTIGFAFPSQYHSTEFGNTWASNGVLFF